jgi:site-specific DNA recombinase
MVTKERRRAIYARFSSDKQREASIDDQIRRCREHIARTGGDPSDALIFADHAISGSSMQRPQFEAMMGAVEAGLISAIYTEDISRISRDFADAAHFFRKLQFLQVPLISVADGIDTSHKHAKLSFTVKSLVADLYLDDLRDKTLRGLEGRALAGYATGRVPYGFRTVPEVGPYGNVIGHRIEIDEEAAKIIRRIFRAHLKYQSLDKIARDLNVDGIPSPRQGQRHKRFGWSGGTIRAMLYNECYVGIWKFKEKQWVKVPGTNRRQPRMRPESEVMRFVRPELRIIDEDTWNAVQARLAAIHRKYTRNKAEKNPHEHVLTSRRVPYLFSGIVVCDECGAPLGIMSGSHATYYKCSTAKTKGTCPNKMSIREADVKREVLKAMRAKLRHPASLAYVRAELAKKAKERSKEVDEEIKSTEARIKETDAKLRKLVEFIADGDRSESIVTSLRNLEMDVKVDRGRLAKLKAIAAEPIHLPSPEEITAEAFDLKALMDTDVQLARGQLKRWLRDGEVRVSYDQETKTWTAKGAISTFELLNKNPLSQGDSGPSSFSKSSGGRI